MQNHQIQGHRLPNVLKRGLAAITGCAFSLGCLLSHAQVHLETPIVDYSTSQLAQLETLDGLVPADRFTVEAIIFRRLDTSNSLLAQAETSGSNTAETLDSREPLLIAEPRSLPANLFDLSPAARIEALDEPLLPAESESCIGPDIQKSADPAEFATSPDVLEPVDKEVGLSGFPTTVLPASESARTTLFGNKDGAFSGTFLADLTEDTRANDSLLSDTLPSRLYPQFLALPRNQTEITPTPYLALIHGVTAFTTGIELAAYRRLPNEELALHDLVRRLKNSGEFEVVEQLAWQQPVPERGNPQPIYVNLSNGEVQGHLAVTLGRYLHTQAKLWLEQTPTEPTSDPAAYAQLDQSQRMRSGELHYFDHPLFGLLVRIDKVSPPAALKAQFETFQSGLEEHLP